MSLFDFVRELFGGSSDDSTQRPSGDGQTRADAGGSGSGRDAGGDEGGNGEADDGDVKDVTDFGPAEFSQEAEEFAADHEEQEFDFTLDSLERLDEYAAAQTEVLDVLAEGMDDPEALTGGMREGYILWFGSYFGEVLVREFDGEWVTDGDGVHVEIPAGDSVVEAPALDAGVIAVDDDPQFAAMASELQREVDQAERGVDPNPVVGGDDDAEGAEADGDGVAADPSIPTVDLEPGSDLDGAHERAVEAFNEAGFYVTEGTVMNSVEGPLTGIAKLFNFHDDAGMYTGIVYTGEWDEDVINGVLSLASSIRPDPADGVFLVSATEPPAAISYLTGAHPRSVFVLNAMAEVQNGPAFDANSADHFADLGQELLATQFGVQIDVDDLAELETLDDVVLSELRTVDDEEQSEEGYVPREALILVGTLAGEVMRRALERDHGASATWTDGEAVSSTGVALSVTIPDGDSMTVNPVGKAFKLFENGSEDSLAFMYRTTVGVLQDEL